MSEAYDAHQGGLMAATRRLVADRSANFAVMTALCTPVALALTAFAIDEGSLYNERRAAQSIVDLAAITAASNITNAQQAVLTTLADNGITSVAVQQQGTNVAPTASKAVVQIVPGRYTGVSTIAAGSRFEAGKLPYNAVQVSLKKQGTLYFAGSIMAPPHSARRPSPARSRKRPSRSAHASPVSMAAFSTRSSAAFSAATSRSA
ncbi:pilus assembly protein TadG-related protein [Mesorhizobium atlanticum]